MTLALACAIVLQSSSKKYELRMRPKAGCPSHTQLDIHFETVGRPGTLDTHFTTRDEFLEQTKKGFKWHVTLEKVDSTATGQYADIWDSKKIMGLEGRSYLMWVNSKGQIVAVDPPEMDARSIQQCIFPDHPVAIGDKWISDGLHRLEFTLSKVVEENGIKEAVILSLPLDPGSIKFDGPIEYRINLATGDTMLYELKSTVNREPAIKSKIKLIRTYDKA